MSTSLPRPPRPAGLGVGPAEPHIHVHVVEDHDEALKHILDAAGAKKIPLEGNTLVHLDAHPDLLVDRTWVAEEDLADKVSATNAVSIENWIMPACYFGIISRIVWVKPPWSGQIGDGRYDFAIGRSAKDGRVRLTCAENYFLSEGIVCRKEELEKGTEKQVELLVVTLNEDAIEAISNFVLEHDLLEVILDIDLDFYSTRNPFLDLYPKVKLYERLKELYVYTAVPETLLGEERLNFSLNVAKERSQLLDQLGDIFEHLDSKGTLEDYKGIGIKYLEVVSKLRVEIESHYPSTDIDWSIIHNAGCTCDNTELPHHISNTEEISRLVDLTKNLAKRLPSKPRLVTVARSSLDDFCPVESVDGIQERVVRAIEETCENVLLHFNHCEVECKASSST